MFAASYSISPVELWRLIGTADAPQVVDVRRRDVYDASPGLLPAAIRREPENVSQWAAASDPTRSIVIACKAGHEVSQTVTAELRARNLHASVLAGGYAAWIEAGLPLADKAALDRFAPKRPSLWVTRRRPKIDRVACPWLIRRFLDPEAKILFVDPPEVPKVAQETGGIPFDIEGVELSHQGERCSFDTMLQLFGLESEPSLARLALIVRGADTARPDLAAEAAGLHAISLGLSALAGDDDHGLLERGFMLYDALFAWLRFAGEERHNWPARVLPGKAA
jgi:rhodanese-related sulfurtransferase